MWLPALIPGLEQRVGAQDELEDNYRKWLREDVLYITSPEEAEVFLKLTTDQERELFIEQFWRRRDTDPGLPSTNTRKSTTAASLTPTKTLLQDSLDGRRTGG